MSFEIDVSVQSGCVADDDGMCIDIKGERRVKNAMVGEEPIGPGRIYKIAGADYVLHNNGGGQTAFDDSKVIQDDFMIDSQALIDYLKNTLNGSIGSEYADPYGHGRIVITGSSD